MQICKQVCLLVLVLAFASACNRTPVLVPAQYDAPTTQPVSAQRDHAARTCNIFLASVRDLRDDPTSMGTMGPRAVRSENSVEWVRSAVLTLDHDVQLHFVSDEAGADLSLQVELLKAYIMGITTQKSSNVVVRVRFLRHSAQLGEVVLRGRETGANWVNGEGEMQSQLDAALGNALLSLREQLLFNYCPGAPTAPAH